MAAINEKQKILEQQRQEIEEIERNSDREVSFVYKRHYFVSRKVSVILPKLFEMKTSVKQVVLSISTLGIRSQ